MSICSSLGFQNDYTFNKWFVGTSERSGIRLANEHDRLRKRIAEGKLMFYPILTGFTKEVWLGIKEDKDELSYGVDSKTHWCEPVRQEHEEGYTLWASCDPYHEICDGGGIPNKKLKHYWKSTNDDDRISLEREGLRCTNWLGGKTREKTITEEHEDTDECGETKAIAIIRIMINKLPEEWFSGVSRDMDDLEGIIDYLEPTLYDGLIDHNDEAYKQRRNKLLGMPYTEPPSIIKEEAEITKYNLGAGEVFLKSKILNIK
ncbi:hypothetical protein Tco_1330103 [Tanacetum coccineum]